MPSHEYPADFPDAYAAFRERYDWGRQRMKEQPDDIRQARMIADDICGFVAEWRPRLAFDAEFFSALGEFGEIGERIGRQARKLALERLEDLVEARDTWFVGEALLQADIALIEMWKIAPEPLRSELEKIVHEHGVPLPFDPEQVYRTAEKHLEEDEADYRRKLAAFEIDCPELMNEALRRRLDAYTREDYEPWKAEIARQVAALGS